MTAFADERPPFFLALPRIDRDTAIRLALAHANLLAGRTDEQVTSAEFSSRFADGEQRGTWMVTTGVPEVDPASGTPVWSFGFAIEVDVVSGTLVVAKGY